LKTRTHAHRLLLSEDGRKITGVEVESRGEQQTLKAETYVVACGAVNSAALLLQSGDSEEGIANKTGLVGRNYMAHNNTALIALHPFKKNPTVFQKTLALNDFYFDGPNWNYPMGNLQLIGQVQGIMLKSARPAVPLPLLNALASRTLDWWVMSEDLPDPDNRITLTPAGSIRIRRKMNNQEAHRRLLKVTAEILKEAGYPFVFSEPMGIETNSHQCGTIRFGEDGATSVLDPYCKAHDLDNLYVVDASFFPSSTAVNPALTIAAQALRVGEHLIQTA